MEEKNILSFSELKDMKFWIVKVMNNEEDFINELEITKFELVYQINHLEEAR